MLFLAINFGMLILFGIGAYICYKAKAQKGHPLYNYGLWSFGLFFISRLMSSVQPLLLNLFLEQNMTPGEMPIWATGLNIFRELLMITAFIVIAIGFYKSFLKEKSA